MFFFPYFVHRRIRWISTSLEISFGIGSTCYRWAVGLVSWCSRPLLWALVWGLHFGCRYKRHVAGAPKHPDGVICCCYEFCSPNIYEDLGNWPTKTHSSWDASGSIFIQAPSPVDGGQLHVILDVSWGWFLFLPASPAYRQWAMQPFHLQRKRTLFFCLFFLEEHVDLYSL